jgi:hypothetical protein
MASDPSGTSRRCAFLNGEPSGLALFHPRSLDLARATGNVSRRFVCGRSGARKGSRTAAVTRLAAITFAVSPPLLQGMSAAAAD